MFDSLTIIFLQLQPASRMNNFCVSLQGLTPSSVYFAIICTCFVGLSTPILTNHSKKKTLHLMQEIAMKVLHAYMGILQVVI